MRWTNLTRRMLTAIMVVVVTVNGRKNVGSREIAGLLQIHIGSKKVKSGTGSVKIWKRGLIRGTKSRTGGRELEEEEDWKRRTGGRLEKENWRVRAGGRLEEGNWRKTGGEELVEDWRIGLEED